MRDSTVVPPGPPSALATPAKNSSTPRPTAAGRMYSTA